MKAATKEEYCKKARRRGSVQSKRSKLRKDTGAVAKESNAALVRRCEQLNRIIDVTERAHAEALQDIGVLFKALELACRETRHDDAFYLAEAKKVCGVDE